MPWPTPRQDEDGIKPEGKGRITRVASQKKGGGAAQTFLLRGGDGFACSGFVGARLNLDESKRMAACGDEIDFTERRFVPGFKKAIEFKV